SAFHGYSIGNQVLALVQCYMRGIQPGPIATFPGWKEKGRHVRRGERALVLCMPITVKGEAEDERFTRFIYRPRWFVLSQTDGEQTPRSLREVEAECVALICCETLKLDGADYCRGYVQNWNRSGEAIPERSAQRIFHAAAQILKAGALTEPQEEG